MGYYKELTQLAFHNGYVSALGTPSEMKKRNVIKDEAVIVRNHIVAITLVEFYETSGAIEYGMDVVLECELESGHKFQISQDAKTYLNWIKQFTALNGRIEQEFVVLFKGVLAVISLKDSDLHQSYINAYIKQEEENARTAKFEYNVGDVVNIYGYSVYLGEFYYYKPNLKNTDTCTAQLRKYKVYLELPSRVSEDEWQNVYNDGILHVESGKTQYNQPTAVVGFVNVDLDAMKELAQQHMENIFKINVGYTQSRGYSNYYSIARTKNRNSYILTNISKTKENTPEPNAELIARLGWLCDWKPDKKTAQKYDYVKVPNGRIIIPYQYKLK